MARRAPSVLHTLSAEGGQGELRVEDVFSGYGDMRVLRGVTLSVKSGEVLGVLGRNGMGKTTLVHTICGLLPVEQGSVLVNGHPVDGLRPDEITRVGIGLVPQGRRVFASLSVEEHLRLSTAFAKRRMRHRVGGGRIKAWSSEEVYDKFPALAARRGLTAGQLSGGEQQMLAIARALLLDPAFLFLDEPSEGLAPAVVEDISQVVASLAETDLGIVLVEQNLRFVSGVADRVAVMVGGEVAYHGATAELGADESRLQELLGVG